MNELNFDVERNISSINENLEDLVREQRLTNALLRVMIGKEPTMLPKTLWPFAGKSFSIIYRDYSKVLDLVAELAKKDGKRFAEYDGESLGSLGQAICGLNNDDYLLIRNDDLIKLPGSEDLIIKAYKDNKITIFIGKGEQARKIDLDAPYINYIFVSDIKETISGNLLELFPVINTGDNSEL
jgi:hypothetical protein